MTAKKIVMRIVVASSQPCTAACECCQLFFDCEDNSVYSNPPIPAAVEIANGGEINEETAHDNQ